MNFSVLEEVNFVPPHREVARLGGFDIVIQPRAHLVHSDQHGVYGILTAATHAELDRLYTHAKGVLGEVYLPETVIAETTAGFWKPALCYIAPAMDVRPAAADYVDRIVQPAKRFNFPPWYIARLERFRPAAGEDRRW